MAIDDLYVLVHSLTTSEKRYCHLPGSRLVGTRDFQRLFTRLLAHDSPGQALAADLRHHFPGHTLEPARKHLGRVLMQNLRQYEGDRRVDVRLGQLLQESHILYERGLGSLSQERLAKAQQLAAQHERGLYAVLAARQQAEQWVHAQRTDVGADAMAQQHARISQWMEQTSTALQHAALYETLLGRYRSQGTARGPAEVRRLNDLLLEEYQLLSRQKHRSFATQQQHLHFQSAYLRMVGDGAGSLRVYRELDDLFRANPTLWAEQPGYYGQLLEGILADLRTLAQYDQMPYFIDRLRAVAAAPAAPHLAVYYALLRAADQGQFAEADALLSAQPGWADAAALPARPHDDLLLVRIAVGTGQLSAGLQRLNRVLARPARSLPPALYTQSRLMSLLLHARLGNADYLRYALRSVERKLTYPTDGEQLTLTLLRQWLAGNLTIRDAMNQLDTFAGNPVEGLLLRSLDLHHWALATGK